MLNKVTLKCGFCLKMTREQYYYIMPRPNFSTKTYNSLIITHTTPIFSRRDHISSIRTPSIVQPGCMLPIGFGKSGSLPYKKFTPNFSYRHWWEGHHWCASPQNQWTTPTDQDHVQNHVWKGKELTPVSGCICYVQSIQLSRKSCA